MSLEPNYSSPVIEPESKPKKKSSCFGWTCAIIFAVFFGIAILCVGVVYITFQQGVTAIATGAPVIGTAMAESGFSDMIAAFGVVAKESQPVPGDAAHFDPVASVSAVHAYLNDENEHLLSIEAHAVRPDGTVDLTSDTKPTPYVDYKFQRTLETIATRAATENAGSDSNNPDIFYRVLTVNLSKPGQQKRNFQNQDSDTYTTKGMGINDINIFTAGGTPVSDPTCSFADLWDIAKTKDAPSSAVATILYDDTGYHFSIEGMTISLDFTSSCELASE